VNKLNQSPAAFIAGFAYIVGTVLFTVYGQIVLKWRVAKVGALPAVFSHKIFFLLSVIWDPWVLSGLVAGFFAFLCWMAALTEFELSYAYPFMSLSFLLVLVLSAILFQEPLTVSKVVGVGLIVAGIIIGSRG
jgi:drug/metabolite transporter (DMT)-like permease